MDTTSFKNYVCWKPRRVGEVINTEAVATDRAEFLATHVALNRIAYLQSPRAIADTSESRLLEELCDEAEADHHIFAVVQGIPGTGKSHLIRWLKERYAARQQERPSPDVVVLIERANCSLRGTLQQLLASGAFDDETLREQRERLQGAADKLSAEGLADTILNQLQVATHEVDPNRAAFQARDRADVEKLLLDYSIRQELKRSGGPIERLIRFLTIGARGRAASAIEGQRGLRADERPGFDPEDFDFRIETLRAVDSQGYQEARILAQKLKAKPELRKDLATFLNGQLGFAIGRTTALTADDLKLLFGELRQRLRGQGRGLALFIEDITAFTGIDTGLVDVLATQHTGEANRAYCRLASVIGVTDGYFEAHFPDNMKERITHRLTLSATTQQGRPVSDLLLTEHARALLAGQYLNAIRLDHGALERWVANGARLDQLPNACTQCPVRARCHAAFGTVHLSTEDADLAAEVGLYPFNASALSTMYQQLDTALARTPRSLLNSVVAFVLQSHRPLIEEGAFPPSPRMVGSDFRPPALKNPAQHRLLAAQSGSDTDRVESLLVFWGDGTIDAALSLSGERTVGGLSEDVFQAFSLPVITGSARETSPASPSSPVAEGNAAHVEEQREIGNVPPSPVLPHPEQPSSPALSDRAARLTQDVSDWRGGAQLRNHELLRKYLEDFIQTAIDWEAHSVAHFQWDERASRRRIAIEDQAGRALPDSLVLPRSVDLAYVLQALIELNEGLDQLNQPLVGSHLATLSGWLLRNEARIVAYVRQPNGQNTEPRPLLELLTLDSVFLSWLSGELHVRQDHHTLLLTLLNDSAAALQTPQQAVYDWSKRAERAEIVRSSTWSRLMRRLNGQSAGVVVTCRANLLRLMNRPQGESTSVRFVDAAGALDVLAQFEREDWVLPAIELQDQPSAPGWAEAIGAFSMFHTYLPAVIHEERERLRDLLVKVDAVLGDASPDAVQQAIAETLAVLKENSITYSLDEQPPSTPATVTRVRTILRSIVDEQGRAAVARKLSAADKALEALLAYKSYLENVVKQFQQREQSNRDRLAALEHEGNATRMLDAAENAYVQLEQWLAQVATSLSVGDVVL